MTSAIAEHNTVTTPTALLEIAVQQGADIDKLTKLMDLQERWEKTEARKAYVSALAQFTADVPAIAKTRAAHNTKYAGLAETIAIIKPTLQDNGLSYTWKTSQEQGLIKVRCIVTHIQGHSEETELTAAPDDSGKKNSIQAVGSAVSYLERYTLYAILGLASEDDDGNSAGKVVDTITEEQCLAIEALITDHDLDFETFHKWLASKGLEHIDQIPVNQYRAVIRNINTAIEAKKA